jgi:hypothetical protein
MNTALVSLGHPNMMILCISVFGKELSKIREAARRGAPARLKARAINVEKSRPGAAGNLVLGQRAHGIGNATAA